MRSLPLVLVIFWFYFLVPYIGQWLTGASRPIRVGAFASSLITFILFEAAYFSEIMRAGIQSISKGQPAAPARWPDLRPEHALYRAAAGVPQHAAGAADADHRAVPGHLAGLRALDPGLPRRASKVAQRDGGWSRCICSRHRLFHHFLFRVLRRPAPQARIAIVR
jgi:ABC-type amino acid transport system, permease component